jgi:pyrroline-5-carboxylate reductase
MTLPPLLLVGGGRMGSALLAGWREQGLTSAIVIDPSPEAQKLVGRGIQIFPTPAEIPHGFTPEAVILAVKPQMAAAVRQGFTVAVANSHASQAGQALATSLLQAAGQIAWVADESLLDPVTAISGGGPAYVFLLTELMEQAAIAQGIPAPLARAMARQTVIGSAALLSASDEDAAALRIAVTSPAGTTERALAVLRADTALPKLFAEAIEAATQRSRELSD